MVNGAYSYQSIGWYPLAPALSQPAILTGREPEISGLRPDPVPLIVHLDDDTSLNLLVCIVLTRAGFTFEMRHFVDGWQTLEFCQQTKPDLLITDIMHPGLDAIELCSRTRQLPQLADMPVIIFSARTPDLWWRPPPDVTYLPKPALPNEIVSVIGHALGRADGLA